MSHYDFAPTRSGRSDHNTRCIEKCLRRKDEENSNKFPDGGEGSSPLIEVAAKYFRGNESRDRKGEIALLPTVNVREQAAAPGTVVESMTSIPLAIII